MEITVNEVSFAPAIVNVEGKTVTDRKLFVVQNASSAALLAIAGEKGKVGRAALERVGNIGLQSIAKAASMGNYRPIADYLAAATGEPVVISSRNAFEALPDVYEAKIMSAKMAKDGGFKVDPKTGYEVPSAKHALALRLKSAVTEVIAAAKELVEARRHAQITQGTPADEQPEQQ